VSIGHRLEVDGWFGEGTRAATVAFQEANGLEPDGVVGELTRRTMADLPAAARRTATSRRPVGRSARDSRP
jgi:peptidoglycan hydrolase-like protein with peptidoglycan-binding domain